MKPLSSDALAALRSAPTRIALEVTAAAAAAALDVPELKDEWRHQELATFLAAPPRSKGVLTGNNPRGILLDDLEVNAEHQMKTLYGSSQFPIAMGTGVYRCRAKGYMPTDTVLRFLESSGPLGVAAGPYQIAGVDGEWYMTRATHHPDGRSLVEFEAVSRPAQPVPIAYGQKSPRPYWLGVDVAAGKDSSAVINLGPVS